MARQGQAERTLIDGRTVANDSEEWRAECEARYVSMMDPYEAAAYVETVANRRGRDVASAMHSHSFDIANAIDREAQHVAALPTQQARRDHLAYLRAAHGDVHTQRIEAEARRLFAARVQSNRAA